MSDKKINLIVLIATLFFMALLIGFDFLMKQLASITHPLNRSLFFIVTYSIFLVIAMMVVFFKIRSKGVPPLKQSIVVVSIFLVFQMVIIYQFVQLEHYNLRLDVISDELYTCLIESSACDSELILEGLEIQSAKNNVNSIIGIAVTFSTFLILLYPGVTIPMIERKEFDDNV